MGTLFLIVTLLVVVGILLAVVGALVEMSPRGHHLEAYRDAHGRRVGSAPRLD
jgi:hypothetical protein